MRIRKNSHTNENDALIKLIGVESQLHAKVTLQCQIGVSDNC